MADLQLRLLDADRLGILVLDVRFILTSGGVSVQIFSNLFLNPVFLLI